MPPMKTIEIQSPPRFWRSVNQCETPNNQLDPQTGHEFLPGASEWPVKWQRREFLRLLGASFALAGLNSCTRQPLEKIVPYLIQPEETVPGKPLYFATATEMFGFGQGLLVTSYDGRPTKIEGNPSQPASLGATTVWAQAQILDLYDPDRAT